MPVDEQVDKQAMLSDRADSDADLMMLAETLRASLSKFVRQVREQASTPTSTQSETLFLLDQSGPMSIAELARLRRVKHQSMRLVTAQLEAEGLAAKLPDPADRRSQLLSITEKGRDQLFRSRRARAAHISALIRERLSDEERQALAAAIPLINKLS